MVIKMDKSQEFINSGKKLISEYDGANLKEEEEQKPQLLNEKKELLNDWQSTSKDLTWSFKRRAYKHGQFTLSSGKESEHYVNCKPVTLSCEGNALLSHLMI